MPVESPIQNAVRILPISARAEHALDTAKALLRMAAETSCRPMRPCGSRNQRTSQVSIAEIPPNRKRYRVRASFACALCEAAQPLTSFTKRTRAILS